MPPFIPHKRRHSNSQGGPAPKLLKKDSLFNAVDSPGFSASLQDHKLFLDRLNDTEDSLSEISDSESENGSLNQKVGLTDRSEDENDEDLGWEDAMHADAVRQEKFSEDRPGDIILDLKPDAHAHFISSNPYDKKKGPTKVERQIRVATHCMHVQFLLFHNLIRNAWCCDKEAQSILVEQLPLAVKKEVDRWRALSGINVDKPPDALQSSSKGKQRRQPDSLIESERNQRDWGMHAEKQEIGVPDLSRGDPLIRVLKVLASYWKKKFTITAPSLRKQGYKSLAVLEGEVTSFKHDEHDPEKHGEHLAGVHQFRQHARICEGSRDIGVQLFTTLVRGLGIEARLVASLQPVGFGWGKGEEALAVKKKKSFTRGLVESNMNASQIAMRSRVQSASCAISPSLEVIKSELPKSGSARARRTPENNTPSSISDDSDAPTVHSNAHSGDDDDTSLVELNPSSPLMKRKMQYDRDILFPTYWTEAISPISSDIFSVDAFLLSPAVATCEEHLAAFEPRGAKAEKVKQVLAYVVGYSSDGTAKDVTTRYLRRHMWPGRTKGLRLPLEKVAVYNQRGKIRYYEDCDWFKTVMSGYVRTSDMRTAVDDLEEAKDLKVPERHKKESKERRETLQGYKTSADFVLERHLRREEAILPGSKAVKTFLTGKGENAKEEPVYSRKDVAICRTGESWHKEGRQVKAGEQPIKMVPVRAVTLNRKREVEEAERAGGEKIRQGLYALDQTDWIIPPPIQNGVIPKNAFGNIDCYVPTMVPRGAVHLPLKSTSKICKRLNIDFAEACTGFEFGNQRAVPVITGVVVAAEHENLVMAEWEKDEAERKAKEEGKRERVTLATWRKMLIGLRIMKRVQENYGGDADGDKKEDMNPFTNKRKNQSMVSLRKKPLSPAAESFSRQARDTTGEFITNDMDEGIHVADNDSHADAHHRKCTPGIESEFSETEGGGFIAEPEDGPPETQTAPVDPTPENEVQVEYNTNLVDRRNQVLQLQGQPHRCRKPPKSTKTPRISNGKTPTHKTQSARIQKKNPSQNPVQAINLSSIIATASTSSTMQETPSRRTAPKRAAAVRSEKAVKSHYFAHDSDDDDDDNDNDTNPAETSASDKEQSRQSIVAALKRRGRPSSSLRR